MEYSEAKKLVKARLSEKRWTHTKNVKKMAVKLARRWGTDPEKAAMAAILHDSAKDLPKQELLQIFADNAIIAENAPARPSPVWHGIAAAILALMENQKLVAEGAGATPVAAALFGKLPIEGKKVVCLISGGNIDVNILNRVITRGLVMSGRKANLTIALEDKPGQLERVAAIVSRCGSNVVSVLHDGSDPNMPISSCFLKLVLETRDHAQIEQIRQELTKEGFQLVAERV